MLPIWHDSTAANPSSRLGESCSTNRVEASALLTLCELSCTLGRPIRSNSFKDCSASFRPTVLANACTHDWGNMFWSRDPPSQMIKLFGMLAEALVYVHVACSPELLPRAVWWLCPKMTRFSPGPPSSAGIRDRLLRCRPKLASCASCVYHAKNHHLEWGERGSRWGGRTTRRMCLLLSLNPASDNFTNPASLLL